MLPFHFVLYQKSVLHVGLPKLLKGIWTMSYSKKRTQEHKVVNFETPVRARQCTSQLLRHEVGTINPFEIAESL